MPLCKNCHARISKFDKDICPVCGCKNPLDGVTSDTIEFTHGIDGNNPEFKKHAPRKKKKALIYFCTLGWTGLGFYYLRFKPMAIVIWIIANLAFIGGIGCLFFFLTPLKGFGFLISLAICYVINAIVGVSYIVKPNRKDGQGELIL